MKEINQIRISGFGGQGIVLAGAILGFAGFIDGKWVAGSSSYGSVVRGGTSTAEIILSNEPIVFPLIMEADILIAMCQEAYDAYIENVKNDGIVVYDSGMIHPKGVYGLKQEGIPATSMGLKKFQSRQSANIILLAATVKITDVVTRDALVTAIENNVSESSKKLNIRTVDLGFELAEIIC